MVASKTMRFPSLEVFNLNLDQHLSSNGKLKPRGPKFYPTLIVDSKLIQLASSKKYSSETIIS